MSNQYPKLLVGQHDGENIYLSSPSWDCGWYWGWGYLGNKNCHYHVSGLNPNINLHDALIEHFGDTLKVRKSDMWVLAELFQTFYKLRGAAEMYKHGGAYLTTNPCADLIKNSDEITRINTVLLPAIFDEAYKILLRNADNDTIFKRLVKLNVQGDTGKVIDFMFDNNIKPEDIKDFSGITDNDYNHLHSNYFRRFHANKIK